MKDFFGHYYRHTVLGYYIIHPFYLIYENFLKIVPDEKFIKFRFKKHMGFELNLEHPRTFNEKISWLKLNDRTELNTICADKFKVRQYIKDKIGSEYLIPLLFQTKNPQDINAENLPKAPFIIKTNHNSSGGFIIKDKSEANWKRIRFDLKKLLRENYFYTSREWQYKHIEPRIIVEKLLTDEDGNIPYDYKLHCFNGNLVFTQVDLDRQINHTRNLYDRDWNFIPCKWVYENGKEIERPQLYSSMQKLAETIAKDFIYVRVDFYVVKGKIFFGELTFHSETGLGKFTPNSYDLMFGEKLQLNTRKTDPVQ